MVVAVACQIVALTCTAAVGREANAAAGSGRGWTWSALATSRANLFDASEERASHLAPGGPPRDLSKKAQWLLDKSRRAAVHVDDATLRQAAADFRRARTAQTSAGARASTRTGGQPLAAAAPASSLPLPPIGTRFEPVVTLFNLRTREAVPVLPGLHIPGPEKDRTFCNLLRDHFTNQATQMNLDLLGVLTHAALHFDSRRIDIVSGYRSPKYNLTLRKKGREVAETSQHTVGQAVDFRVRGVSTKDLLQFVRSLRLGGVGYYPHSEFVHCDTGPVRYWQGS